jgi:hypothetical protein
VFGRSGAGTGISMPSEKKPAAIFREEDGESVACLFYTKFSKLEYITKNGESFRVALIKLNPISYFSQHVNYPPHQSTVRCIYGELAIHLISPLSDVFMVN